MRRRRPRRTRAEHAKGHGITIIAVTGEHRNAKTREDRKENLVFASSAGSAFLLYVGADDRDDLAARGRPDARRAGRLRRSAVHVVGARVGRHAPGPRLVEREHLRAASAVARLLRAFPAAGAAGAADLRGDEESDPLLQPAVPLDVRAVRPRHVPARPRADRQRRRRLRRGARVRVRAVPHRVASRTCRCCRRPGCRSCCSACAGISRPAALRPLAGAAAAWLVQNLSCGYYLLFFTPGRRPLHRLGADARAGCGATGGR